MTGSSSLGVLIGAVLIGAVLIGAVLIGAVLIGAVLGCQVIAGEVGDDADEQVALDHLDALVQ
ncbi:pentapeptide repeat-containing protein [Aestuariimicrobium ganziense]|uniref:pentapeptide repeat-containing protein n=1 Tax=Aestuariimicrobium ganziense TaxID=2773677 RepID=UPI0038B312A6